MPRTPYFVGVCGFSSMLTLATVSLPAMSVARSSRKGPIVRQGPHHSAQKSTSTGSLARGTAAAEGAVGEGVRLHSGHPGVEGRKDKGSQKSGVKAAALQGVRG